LQAPLQSRSVQLCPAGQRYLCLGPTTIIAADGRFLIDNVPAGTYELHGEATDTAGKTLRTTVAVAVNGQLGEVELRFPDRPKVTGDVRGIPRDHMGGATFGLVIDGPNGRYEYDSLAVKQDGTFENQAPAGSYRLTARYLPLDVYLETVRDGAKDITRSSWNLTQAGRRLEITLREGAASLEGSVTDNDGQPVPVTLWAAAPGGFSATTMSGYEGEFTFWNVPPGTYRVAAWKRTSQGLAEYPEFFRSFGNAARVTLAPGAKGTIEITSSK
jgi:hypothetical protein